MEDNALSQLKSAETMTAARTDAVTDIINSYQYSSDEGPCRDALLLQTTNRIDSMNDEQRWPTFARLAAAKGILSCMAYPLVVKGRTFGSLNLYGRRPGAFLKGDDELCLLLAKQAAVAHAGEAPGRARKKKWGQAGRDRC